MDQRVQFAADWMKDEIPFAELCRRYGISRKTGYKWVGRYGGDGPSGLVERTSRPLTNARAAPKHVVDALLAMRTRYPFWGPRKIRKVLGELNPDVRLPAASTIGEVFKRNGLVTPRRRRGFVVPATQPFSHCDAANDVWCTDFKGHFRVSETRCYPLTIMDAHTRFLLECRGLEQPDGDHVREVFENVFREHGLPLAIRSDNGPPFAAKGAAGLSRLAVWWVRLGIRPDRIEPGHPEQNGRHERMHRTLGQETSNPPEINMDRQQKAFDRFVYSYNHERPHAALGQQPPARFYSSSHRHFDPTPPDPSYPNAYELRRVQRNGTIRWRGSAVFVNSALADELIALRELGHDRWDVYFAFLHLGVLDENVDTSRLITPRTRSRVSPTSPS